MQAVFEQAREQNLLLQYFSDLETGTYVDIGANVPESSVSLPFHMRGWTGFLVEPIPENVRLLRESGRANVWEGAATSSATSSRKTATLHLAGGPGGGISSLEKRGIPEKQLWGSEITVALDTVDNLCATYGVKHIDLLSVDTEGTEADVLSGTDLNSLSVRLVLVEDWLQNFNTHKYLRHKGYKLVRRTGQNSWYVSKSEQFPVSLFGHVQLIRKYILSLPVRRLKRWIKIRFREKGPPRV